MVSRVILSVALLMAACSPLGNSGRDTSNYTIDLEVSSPEPAAGQAQLIVTLRDRGGRALDDATVHIEGNMSHAGMVPVLAEAAPQGNGRYVADFRFTMGGDWILTVKATLPDGTAIYKDFDMSVRSR